MKKWKTGVLFVMALLAALLATAAAMQQEQQMLAGKLIRLHVVANSDTPRDQELKLMVRDAILNVTSGQLLDREDAEIQLRAMLPEIQKAAENCLRAHGCQDSVQVTLGREGFSTRVYPTFSLPAGVYRSLRVRIGAGEGQNWWCVVFPSICFRATASDLAEAAEVAGFTQEEIRLITGESSGYELKFKTWELLQALKEKFIW